MHSTNLAPGEYTGGGSPSTTGGEPPSTTANDPPCIHGGLTGIGTVRYPRLVPRDEECAKQLKKRTLSNLYNQNPTWLAGAHRTLDAAGFTAYGWDPAITDDEPLAKLLELNMARAPHDM